MAVLLLNGDCFKASDANAELQMASVSTAEAKCATENRVRMLQG